MAEIINLRRVRKARARAEDAAAAGANRLRRGRSKPERDRIAAEEALAARALDSRRRDEPKDA